MKAKAKPSNAQPALVVDSEVVRQIRQHARSNSKTEVCGVLIGQDLDHRIDIAACIPGQNAEEAGAHVTFTQDTWEHIYAVKDQKYPEERIVGWYHSHPGFGVFLSDHDTFIHKNFFSAPLQVAWVYDPHSDEEGCFGWSGERLERLEEIHIKDDKGGEEAGETGKPEPVGGIEDDEDVVEDNERDRESGPPPWLGWVLTICSHVLLMALAFVAAWLFFPRSIYFFIDRSRGVVFEAPPGTHLNPDGTLAIPRDSSLPDRILQPAQVPPPANPAESAPNSSGTKDLPDQKPKDQNVPRK